MSLTCNIDARGKAARLGFGIAGLVIGVVLLFGWALPADAPLPWMITVGMLVGAAFAIFEARAGWCALRAMGIHTRL